MEKNKLYRKKGQMVAGGAVTAILILVVGLSVVTLVLIFTGVLGGKVYNLVEDDINNISDTTIKTHIQDGIKAGFESNKETAEFMPVVSMAVIIFIVLSMVIGFTALTGAGRQGGIL